jgi:hypothetical protein
MSHGANLGFPLGILWAVFRVRPLRTAFGLGGHLGARGATPHAASLGLFTQGFVAKTCREPAPAAFWLRALGKKSGARRRDGLHHGLL